MSLESTPIQAKVVLPQDTKPDIQEDGVIWVDTSQESRPIAVYSTDTGQWEPVKTDVPVLVTQEAVSYAETEVTVKNNDAQITGGTLQLADSTTTGTEVSRDPDNSTASTGKRNGLVVNPNEDLDGLRLTVSGSTSGVTTGYIEDTGGNVLAQAEISDGYADVLTPLTAGTDYYVTMDAGGSTYTSAWDGSPSFPYTGPEVDIVDGVDGGSTIDRAYNVLSVQPVTQPTEGYALVEWDSIPDDLTAWDIATWQRDRNGGTVRTDIHTNDGSGWSVLVKDVVAPYDISSIDPGTDVRLAHRMWRDTGGDPSPVFSYSARRGER